MVLCIHPDGAGFLRIKGRFTSVLDQRWQTPATAHEVATEQIRQVALCGSRGGPIPKGFTSRLHGVRAQDLVERMPNDLKDVGGEWRTTKDARMTLLESLMVSS